MLDDASLVQRLFDLLFPESGVNFVFSSLHHFVHHRLANATASVSEKENEIVHV